MGEPDECVFVKMLKVPNALKRSVPDVSPENENDSEPVMKKLKMQQVKESIWTDIMAIRESKNHKELGQCHSSCDIVKQDIALMNMLKVKNFNHFSDPGRVHRKMVFFFQRWERQMNHLGIKQIYANSAWLLLGRLLKLADGSSMAVVHSYESQTQKSTTNDTSLDRERVLLLAHLKVDGVSTTLRSVQKDELDTAEVKILSKREKRKERQSASVAAHTSAETVAQSHDATDNFREGRSRTMSQGPSSTEAEARTGRPFDIIAQELALQRRQLEIESEERKRELDARELERTRQFDLAHRRLRLQEQEHAHQQEQIDHFSNLLTDLTGHLKSRAHALRHRCHSCTMAQLTNPDATR